jgi:hypothetical protein
MNVEIRVCYGLGHDFFNQKLSMYSVVGCELCYNGLSSAKLLVDVIVVNRSDLHEIWY